MTRPGVRELGRGRLLLDLQFRSRDELVAAYLIPGPDGWTVVETGPTTCLDSLLAGLGAAGIEPERVARVLVTHIHLDHAGGLGATAGRLPRAELGAHRAGVRHLVDPSRLIESARRAWGAAADPLWGTVVPVPGDRLRPLDGGERFAVNGGELEVIATPGHARHHLSFFDAPRRAMITGDSAGVFLPGSSTARPAIPPPDLDLGQLFESLRAMGERRPSELDYTHFGPVPGGAALLEEYRRSVERWAAVALEAAQTEPSVAHVAGALRAAEMERISSSGSAPTAERQELISGVELAAQGLLRYFQSHGELPSGER
ncbi:MAG TPA: MBL fold metallo-hydrolase [Thermoplasmata archaeon]|nr:MBL fold metallo-hydrolase [Thermoplasmata archaeon]